MGVQKMKQISYEFEHLLISRRSDLSPWPKDKPNGNEFANRQNWKWTKSKERRLEQRWFSLCELRRDCLGAMHSVDIWLGQCIGVEKSRMDVFDAHCIKQRIILKMVRSKNGHLHRTFLRTEGCWGNFGNHLRWRCTMFASMKATLR